MEPSDSDWMEQRNLFTGEWEKVWVGAGPDPREERWTIAPQPPTDAFAYARVEIRRVESMLRGAIVNLKLNRHIEPFARVQRALHSLRVALGWLE